MKSMIDLRVAVIGLGNMGRHHVRHFSTLPGVRLVGVCDARPEVAQDFARQYTCTGYTDASQLILEQQPDAVSIIAPTHYHFELAKLALQSGCHVLVEKPISATLAEADALVAMASVLNLTFTVGHIERFNPTITALHTLITSGDLGTVLMVNAHRASPLPQQIRDANVLLDLAVHDIDLCNFLIGSVPTQVTGKSFRVHLPDRDDGAHLFLAYPQASASVNVNWFCPTRVRRVEITGSLGYAFADTLHQKLTYWIDGQPDPIVAPIPEGDALLSELTHFVDCIRFGHPPLVSGQAARDALAIAIGADPHHVV